MFSSGSSLVRNRKWFGTVYRECYPRILAYVRRRCSGDVAEDLTADVFLRAWRQRSTLRHQQPLPWLYGIARNVVAEHYRGNQRWDSLQEKLQPRVVGSASVDESEAVAGQLDIYAALAALSIDDRELLALHCWEHLSHKEIAVALGISPGAARVRLHRARARLQAQLEEQV